MLSPGRGESKPDGVIEQAIRKNAALFPRAPVKDFTYGTAGFRMREDLLDYVIFTVGCLASARSRCLGGKAIGIMITASHNPAEDNGVKLVDPMGDMLHSDWEHAAEILSNSRDPETLVKNYGRVIQEKSLHQTKEAHVIFARDTRPSGERLVKALTSALDATKTKYTDFGILTTPQLHYLVRSTNTQDRPQPYGVPTEEAYYRKLADAFTNAMCYTEPNKNPVTVDCANGVGAPKLKELIKYLPPDLIKVNFVNDRIDKPEDLNNHCGADYVKTQQRVPDGFTGKPFDRWCAYDGDADRIIYFFVEEGNIFRMLDGDRIATLAATYIGELVEKAGLKDKIKLAVVQTAYANGASTKYIEKHLKLKVEFTPTGVKHLHHVAARADIGVYFEANGHGTVLFNDVTLRRINITHQPESPKQLEALQSLRALTDLINQTVGDALSDMLLVEAILAHKEYSVKEWLATYTDLPNKLGKVLVWDRNIYQSKEGSAERVLERPPGMQEKIDHMVAKYKDGRCFVRASGTENAVRVYGEAAEIYDVEDMVGKVTELISSYSSRDIEPALMSREERAAADKAAGLGREKDPYAKP